MKESFVFFETWAEAIRQMPDKERLQVFDAIMAYGIYGAKTEIGGLAQMALNFVFNDIDDCKKKRNEKTEKARESANKRWQKANADVCERVRTNTNAYERNQTDAGQCYNVNVNGNVNVNDNVNVLGGDFKNSAVADATTQTEESGTDFSTPIVENSASPKKEEKGCGEKEERETVEERILKFRQKVSQIAQGQNYPADIVEDFCRYWLEMNEGGKKMRFETEKIFNHQMRLVTWINNEKKWEARRKPTSRPTTTAQSPAASNSVDDIWGVNNH